VTLRGGNMGSSFVFEFTGLFCGTNVLVVFDCEEGVPPLKSPANSSKKQELPLLFGTLYHLVVGKNQKVRRRL
jgi:hypothetical protein